MKYVKSLSQLAKQIPNVETGAVGISERNCQRWAKKFGWKKGKAGYSVAACLRDVEQALAKLSGGGGNADLMAELLESKIGILEIRQEQIEARLTGVEKVRNEARRIGGGYLKAIRAWQQITVAMHPELVRDAEALAKPLSGMIQATMMT